MTLMVQVWPLHKLIAMTKELFSLDHLIGYYWQERLPFPEPSAMVIVADVVSALRELHERGSISHVRSTLEHVR